MQISIVIVEPGPGVKPVQASQSSDEETIFEEVVNILRNLLRGGMQPMSIAYTGTDCVITLSTDRKDWIEFFDTRDPDTGRSPRSKMMLLAQKAMDMGLGTSAEPVDDLAQRALVAGVELVERDGVRVAMSQEELLKEGQDRVD